MYSSREQINSADFRASKSKNLDIAPEVVANATAYTAVDKAEEDKEQAELVNHLAVANIADVSQLRNCWLIHLSTDYVFDGNAKFPYKEDDKTNPQGAYGGLSLRVS